MPLDRFAFGLFTVAGVPKADALPKFTIFRSRALEDRTPPTGALATAIPLLGGNVYGCTASAADVEAATAYVIDAGVDARFGSGARYAYGALCLENSPWFVQAFFDTAGALYAGAGTPTIDVWSTFAAVDTTPHPVPVVIASPYLWGFTPGDDALRTGHAFRWAAPASAVPTGAAGAAFFSSVATVGASALEQLIAVLLASSTVTDLVVNRIHVNYAPQREAWPFVVLREITAAPQNSLDGLPGTRARSARVQIDSYAAGALAARNVADAIETVVASLQGPTIAAQRIDGRDLFEDETMLDNASRDYQVWT